MSDDSEHETVAYTLKIDTPSGSKVQIPGLGTFENGSTYEITESEAHAFRVYHTRQRAVVGESNEILGSETVLGPTLEDAAKAMYGVEVTNASGDTFSRPETPEPSVEETATTVETQTTEGGEQ